MVTTFLRRMVAHGYVRRATYARRTQLYHVHHAFFYDALGDANSPFQRRAGPRAMVRRLMTVDTLLAFPDTRALGMADEKRDYFVTHRSVREGLLPVRWDRRGRHGPRCIRQLLPDRTPILIEPDGEGVALVYVQRPASSLGGWIAEVWHMTNRHDQQVDVDGEPSRSGGRGWVRKRPSATPKCSPCSPASRRLVS